MHLASQHDLNDLRQGGIEVDGQNPWRHDLPHYNGLGECLVACINAFMDEFAERFNVWAAPLEN
jgi:hypothetical protein